MVDYSRFDRLAKALEEEEEREQATENRRREPVVTKYDEPMRVMLEPSTSASDQPSTSPVEEHQEQRVGESFVESQPPPPSERRSATGLDVGAFYWGQTPEEVHLGVRCPAETKGKDVKVELIHIDEAPRRESFSSTSVLVVQVRGRPALRGALAFEVRRAGDEDLEWQIIDEAREGEKNRVILITLIKKPVGVGVVQWWSRVFAPDAPGIPEHGIDTATISQRSGSAAHRVSAQKIWEDAHVEFRRRVQARKAEGRVALEGASLPSDP